ncbi:DUF305 domain-containing protein [Niallia sp. MER 6]|uniref:DUF305 domain-containing protein n=1 Tax=Niallia sp. MER 6 TaxID=2939567 RepID=UPI0020409084|nr:DUF305 domain-containing protein [Niallia sp. MER 6]MCM3033834.1 DUF305 domain-containing protein [Niallia sp. MER 6]
MNKYGRFGAMVLTSTIIMLCLMYLNTYQVNHIFFSETRLYMAIMMGAAMSIIMLVFMLKMYTNKKANISIFIGSATVFVLSLLLVRSQATVNDASWMKAMIPHHSIAIMTSERATLKDPRVKELANNIIDTQKREIEEMKELIKELEEKSN